MNNKKFFSVRGIAQVGTPPVSLISSFSSTSTTFNPYYNFIYGVCFHPTDGYLYTIERDTTNNSYYFVKRNATTGAYISSSPSLSNNGYGTGLAITSDGSFWTIARTNPSTLKKYNSGGVYQNYEFGVTGYYANLLAGDDNDIFYLTRESTNTIYTYNTSGVGQGTFSIGTLSDKGLMHASGTLHRATSGTQVYVRDIAGATNVSSWNMPSTYKFRDTSDYDSTLGFAWINAFTYVEKFTPNF